MANGPTLVVFFDGLPPEKEGPPRKAEVVDLLALGRPRPSDRQLVGWADGIVRAIMGHEAERRIRAQSEAHHDELAQAEGDWQALRKAVFRRDVWRCQWRSPDGTLARCLGGPLHPHHLVYNHKDPVRRRIVGLEELVSLCPDHHSRVHAQHPEPWTVRWTGSYDFPPHVEGVSQ
jgi:hypothetical protein